MAALWTPARHRLSRGPPLLSPSRNEVDTLGTYAQLSGAATLARALAQPLLALQWASWDPSELIGSGFLAGWAVGCEYSAPGHARMALLWAYNRNFTWSDAHAGEPRHPVEGSGVTLRALPLDGTATATVVCYNTTTGLPLPGGGGCSVLVSGADVTVSFAPTFVDDAAAVVTIS